MTIAETEVVGVVEEAPSRVEWGPVIAGAIAAAALAFVLHAFAAGIGIAVSSTAPTWRDASIALVLLSGLYLLLAAFASYGFGAYVAARLRRRRAATAEDGSFSDGMHGLMVWALATLLTAILAVAVAGFSTRLAAPAGTAGSSQSVAGENIIALDLDRLFRADRRPQTDMAYARAEAARILLTASSHRGMLPEDRQYLVRLVSANTGLKAWPRAPRRTSTGRGAARRFWPSWQPRSRFSAQPSPGGRRAPAANTATDWSRFQRSGIGGILTNAREARVSALTVAKDR
jgi:hypothetical protein